MLHPYSPIMAIFLQWPLSSVPKVAIIERFHCTSINVSVMDEKFKFNFRLNKPEILRKVNNPNQFITLKTQSLHFHGFVWLKAQIKDLFATVL